MKEDTSIIWLQSDEQRPDSCSLCIKQWILIKELLITGCTVISSTTPLTAKHPPGAGTEPFNLMARSIPSLFSFQFPSLVSLFICAAGGSQAYVPFQTLCWVLGTRNESSHCPSHKEARAFSMCYTRCMSQFPFPFIGNSLKIDPSVYDNWPSSFIYLVMQ